MILNRKSTSVIPHFSLQAHEGVRRCPDDNRIITSDCPSWWASLTVCTSIQVIGHWRAFHGTSRLRIELVERNQPTSPAASPRRRSLVLKNKATQETSYPAVDNESRRESMEVFVDPWTLPERGCPLHKEPRKCNDIEDPPLLHMLLNSGMCLKTARPRVTVAPPKYDLPMMPEKSNCH